MARGRIPKDPSKLSGHHGAAETRQTILPGSPVPAPRLLNRNKLLPATRAWWDTWAGSPQGQHFLGTDWQRLSMLSVLVDAFYREPKPSTLAEIRLSEAGLGCTLVDRARLHWSITPDAPAPAAEESARRADPRQLRAVTDIRKGHPA